MEEGKCGFCHTGDETNDICGTLYKGNVEGKTIVAHHKCMQYSALLIQNRGTFEEFGGFKKKELLKEIHRGNQLECCLCKKDKSKRERGAASGCALKSCSKTFHYYCAAVNPNIVARRIPVWTSNKVFSLYRVFCSKAHEEEYIKNIRSRKDILKENTSESSEDEEDQMSDGESGDRTFTDNTHVDDGNGHESDDEPAKKKQKTNDETHDDESGPDSPGMSTKEVIPKTPSQYNDPQESTRPKGQLTTNEEAVQEGQVSCACCCSELHNLKERKVQLEIKLLEFKIRKVDQ